MGQLNTAFLPVTYTNQNEHQRDEGCPAGVVVYVTGFFFAPDK